MTAAPTEVHIDVRADLVHPLPSQTAFLDAMWQRKYLLFGGAAGPGKSYVLRWALIEFLMYWGVVRGVRNVRVGLFCEDYPTLKDRQVSRLTSGLVNRSDLPMEEAVERGLLEPEFPEWLGQVRETRAEGLCFFLREEFGGGFIALRNLDDPAKYASSEFAAIGVDELTKNHRETFDNLRFRLRWPGIPHTPFLAASNPGSIGHAWVKQLFIDRDFTGDNERIDPSLVGFIPAKAGENVHLTEEYWETLDSLPEAMRRAMKEGDWNVFAGQAFSEWRPQLHVVEPFRIPLDWTRWTSTDYGYSAPWCTLWFARPPDRKRLYVYRELYESGVRASRQAELIAEASMGEGIRLHVADPSMWQTRENDRAGTSLAEEYQRAGITLRKADNNRLAGKGWVHEALAWHEPDDPRGALQPRLQVFANCTNLIRTLPALPYDPIRVEDVDTKAEDHPYDSLRYGLGVERRQVERGTKERPIDWGTAPDPKRSKRRQQWDEQQQGRQGTARVR